jgi:hypothetical protein
MPDKIKAEMRIASGGEWVMRETEYEAVTDLIINTLHNWSHLFDVKRAAQERGVVINLYDDAGTDRHEDDTYIKTIKVVGNFVEFYPDKNDKYNYVDGFIPESVTVLEYAEDLDKVEA